jgi:hypothetical protein
MSDEEKGDSTISEFMMASPIEYKMPAPLQLDAVGDLYQKWRKFKQQLRIFISAAGLEKVTESRKANILLNCIGQDAQDLYFNILKKEDTTIPKYEELITLYDGYFEPKQNELISTFHFNNRVQEEDESFDSFYSEIRKLVKSCNFKELEDRMLRDRIVMGVRDKKMQQKLLETSDLTLDRAVDRCRAAELSQEHARTMQKNERVHGSPMLVDVLRRQQNEDKYNNNMNKLNKTKPIYNSYFYHCLKCDRDHGPRECPAYGKLCMNCQRMNHFAKGCKNRPVHVIQEERGAQQHQMSNNAENNFVHDM